VLAVLVAHDGAAWLPETLAALRAQTHPALEILAVDNASADGSRELLLDHLGPERVLIADRDLGFGGAVSMALDARPVHDAPYVLLVHDDLVLAEDAVERLVAALEHDPRLALAGPKLRSWDSPGELQSVGWTIDLTGRADSGVDAGELDQGQRDQERRPLYVSSAGMLVRREVFEAIGRFDRRFHVFRDDLDLCWRAWLAGHDVEVVPEAVGRHVAGATNYLRLGQTRFIGPRYFAERNTLATLVKNYGLLRLPVVLLLYIVVGVAKVLGFLLTRRVSDAWQTIRAWAWNVVHLAETWRLRRAVQATRARTDAELKPLFGRIAPRLRAYAEAMADWVAGGDAGPLPAPSEERISVEPPSATARVVSIIRNRPVLVVGGVLAILTITAAWPLLLPGELRGGELAPWPSTSAVFFRDYVAGWHQAGAFGTSQVPSPAQALLGALQWVLGGSAYLAPRVLLLGTLAGGWLLALRAAQTFSGKRRPRVVAATAYILSPPALAALATGRIGTLVVLAVLPGILAGGVALTRRGTAAARAWRAVAGVALLTAIGGAFEPLLLAAGLVAGLLAAGIAVAIARDGAWRGAVLVRLTVATVGPVVLLLPWSLDLFAADGPLTATGGESVGGELWRWLVLAPELQGMPGILAGAGFLIAGLLGLGLGVQRTPGLVTGLWAAALSGAVGAWWLDRIGSAIWAGLPLVLTAAAFAGLFALAFASAEAQLTAHAFGWRQLAALVTAAAVVASLGAVAAELLRGPWEAYRVGEPPLPSYVVAATDEVGPFRVLVLADRDGEVAWEVVEGEGPTMAAYGVPVPAAATELVADAVTDILSGGDTAAADRLGTLNVRYLVVPDGGTSSELDAALLAQVGLEPRPVASGRVLIVTGWLPRAAVLGSRTAERLEATGELPDDAVVQALPPSDEAMYAGRISEPGVLRIAEPRDAGWRATVEGRTLRPVDDDVVVFEDVPAGSITVRHAGDRAREVAVIIQVILVFLAISLALRPPGFARSYGPRSGRRVGGGGVTGSGPGAPTEATRATREPEVIA
jgi:GT2 family glycosyltransferase